MNTPKLIFINGFSGCGKSTLAQRYVNDHKFALAFEGDNLIVMFGQWRSDWEGAAKLKLAHSKSIVQHHLEMGYDVALPFLLTEPGQADEYAAIAAAAGATFHEFYLHVPKVEAIERLLKRGSWGEPGSPPFTREEVPRIENLFDRMAAATSQRQNAVTITPRLGAVEETYSELCSYLPN